MGINLDKMRAKLSAVQNKGDRGSFWRPNDGNQTIRVVPTADDDPFKEVWFHYNVSKGGILCPKRNFGDDCPICDFASNLWREGADKDDEASKKLAKSLFVRQRFFSPVLVRGEETDGVRWWGYGKTAYESLLNLVLNPDYGDITDTEEGTDLVLNYGKPPGASYPLTKLQPRRRPSPLAEDAEILAGYLSSIQNIMELFERKTTAEVDEILREFVSGGVDAEGNSAETVQYNTSSGDSVDNAFKELMNA
tara:strand:- start:152 stop:901 length:750 start_codon:yes stop_codon:yes gene_type:complete